MKRNAGQILPIVMACIMVLMIVIGGLVGWIQQNSQWTMKNQRAVTAVNFAEAGLNRATWELQSTTVTWAQAAAGTALPGYHFDTTYKEIPGGSYRVNLTSGPSAYQVTIIAEGRDNATREVRALQQIVQNQSVPGSIIAGGTLRDGGAAIAHWGPELAMGRITLSGNALNNHYPRKLSKQDVVPYDANGLTPPNTDNLEWWSDYDVPSLPIFDFVTLKASATASNTLNCDGNYSNVTHQVPCGTNCVNCSINNIYKDNRYDKDYVWYWDHNVTLNNTGVKGTFIVRGNLTVQGGDWYGPNGPYNANVTLPVPANAWMEYKKMDTVAVNEYPGDTGLHSNAATYVLGSCNNACEGSASGDDLGFYGFLYVGGDADFQGDADIFGAVWIVGNWSSAGNNLVFYNERLSLPTLNVVLVRQSWRETTPSRTAWP